MQESCRAAEKTPYVASALSIAACQQLVITDYPLVLSSATCVVTVHTDTFSVQKLVWVMTNLI